jgi:hypothetical protein
MIIEYAECVKSRHASALTLLLVSVCACSRKPAVGWYLMTPPQATNGQGLALVGPDFHAPLNQWQKSKMGEPGKQFEAFDSKEACEAYRAFSIQDARKKLLNAPPGIAEVPSETRNVEWTYFLGTLHVQCVASDDPRLKEN